MKWTRYAFRGPVVVIQEATESWAPTDPTLTSIGHRIVDEFIIQALMIAFAMIVRDVLGHGLPEVPLRSRARILKARHLTRTKGPLFYAIELTHPTSPGFGLFQHGRDVLDGKTLLLHGTASWAEGARLCRKTHSGNELRSGEPVVSDKCATPVTSVALGYAARW